MIPNSRARQAKVVEIAKQALHDWKRHGKDNGKGYALVAVTDDSGEFGDSFDIVRDIRVIPILFLGETGSSAKRDPLADKAMQVQVILALDRAGLQVAGPGLQVKTNIFPDEETPRAFLTGVKRCLAEPITMVLARRSRRGFVTSDQEARAWMGDSATLKQWQGEYADPPIQESGVDALLQVKTMRGSRADILSRAHDLHNKSAAANKLDKTDLSHWTPVFCTRLDLRITTEAGLFVAMLESRLKELREETEPQLRQRAAEMSRMIEQIERWVASGEPIPEIQVQDTLWRKRTSVGVIADALRGRMVSDTNKSVLGGAIRHPMCLGGWVSTF